MICAENVDEAVSEGEHDLGADGKPEAAPAVDVVGEPEADPAIDDDGEPEADPAIDDGGFDAEAPAPVSVTYRYALGDDAVSLSRMLAELGHDHSAIREVDLAGEDDRVRVERDGTDYVVSARERFDEAALTVTTDEAIVCIILTDGRVAEEEPAQTPETVEQPAVELSGTDAETPEVTEEAPETPEEPVGDEATEQIDEPAEEVNEDAAEDKEEDTAEEVKEDAAEEK
ncbi:MAG: hypothetical protein IKE76_12500 [Clostridia bacterium]|nr:hypothetical protein [Clostridia bacterium]